MPVLCVGTHGLYDARAPQKVDCPEGFQGPEFRDDIWCSALIRASHNLSKSGWLKVFEAVELNHNVQAHADLWHAE